MPTARKKEVLDEAASDLYSQLGGVHDHFTDVPKDGGSEDDAQSEEFRIRMIETAHLISAYFLETRIRDGIQQRKDRKNPLSAIRDMIEQFSWEKDRPEHLVIRYRGYPTGVRIPAEHDYVIDCGPHSVDGAGAKSLSEKMGIAMSHVPARAAKAFQIFSDYGIGSLYLRIPEFPIHSRFFENLSDCLNIIAGFHMAMKSDSPIIFEKNGRKTILPLVHDEKGRADFNLTLLAGINALKPGVLRNMVVGADAWMKKAEAAGMENPYLSVYDALIRAKNLKGKFTLPVIEINNMKWLCIDRDYTILPRKKAKLARMAATALEQNPQKTARVVQSVYGKDYQRVESDELGQRLKIMSDFMEGMEKSPEAPEMAREVLGSVHERFDEIRDTVLEDLIVRKSELRIRKGKEETVVGRLHSGLLKIVAFHQKKTETRRKVENITQSGMDFDVRDFKVLARDFGISESDARGLIGLLKTCFTEDGHFQRSVFERHVPDFARYEKKVFNFLWHYLRKTPGRKDRVAFLNSLQLLIDRMRERSSVLEMLMESVLASPDNIDYSDRNAFMLANILLRKYNKELNIDIEMTPEEVLRVKAGIDLSAAGQMAAFMDRDQERMMRKIRTLFREILEALSGDRDEESRTRLRFLLALEREIHILLSLIGGKTALGILRSGADRYGDPASAVYRAEGSAAWTEAFVQHLTVVVRGLARLGQEAELDVLMKIRMAEDLFLAMPVKSAGLGKVRRLMYRIGEAESEIRGRMNPSGKAGASRAA